MGVKIMERPNGGRVFQLSRPILIHHSLQESRKRIPAFIPVMRPIQMQDITVNGRSGLERTPFLRRYPDNVETNALKRFGKQSLVWMKPGTVRKTTAGELAIHLLSKSRRAFELI